MRGETVHMMTTTVLGLGAGLFAAIIIR